MQAEHLTNRVSPALAASQERVAKRATLRSAYQLSREVAPLLSMDEEAFFHELTHVPDNMLSLLDSPEGWETLAAWVASNLGAAAPGYQPRRH